MKQKIETDKAPKAVGPYSQGLVVGNLLVVTSGQIHLKLDGKLLEGTVEKQTHQIMKNLQAVLEEGGIDFSHVIKTTIYLTDMKDYAKVNEVYGSYLKDPFPARETIGVKDLPLNAKIEISMMAVKY